MWNSSLPSLFRQNFPRQSYLILEDLLVPAVPCAPRALPVQAAARFSFRLPSRASVIPSSHFR